MKKYLPQIFAAVLIAACVVVWMVARRGAPTAISTNDVVRGHGKAERGTAAETKDRPLRIGVPLNCYAGLVVLANHQGLFEREGLKVQFVKFRDGKRSFKGMLGGKADVSISGDLPIASIAIDRRDFRILAELGRSDYERWIMAKPGIESAADLRGKSIGTQKRSGSHYLLDDILARQKLTEDDVKVVDIAPKAMAKSIGDGQLDAFVVEHPFLGPARQHFGIDLSELHDAAPGYRIQFALLARKDVVEGKPEEVAHLVRAIAAAADAFTADPSGSMETIAKDPLFAGSSVLEECKVLHVELGLDDAFVARLTDEGGWFLRSGKKKGTTLPDYRELVAESALAAVRPASVRIAKILH